MPKTRQELIDDCKFRVNGLWQDFLHTRPERGSVEYHYAQGRVIRLVDEAIANAVNAAVELAKAAMLNTPGKK